ncbi:MAG: hypothetical protein IJY39_13080 [Clostridia bacterium]|nr:hypothetical protein [Clostridia bacterium]
MTNIIYHDIRKAPFEIFGLYNPSEEGIFRRIPEDVAKATGADVLRLHTYTSGGRIRFRTDSEKVVLKIKGNYYGTWHTTPMMRHGADLYIDRPRGSIFVGAIKPNGELATTAEINMPAGEHDVTVFLPLFGEVSEFEIGLCEGASLVSHTPYKHDLPVVFYGSSITQGACASRPGRAYQAMISRKYDLNYIGLGFSGACRAEKAIAEYMATLDMSAFVSDYDHNAPTHEHLAATHHALYLTIREKHPDIPYFMVTRPDFHFNQDCIGRRDIIMKSYLDARAAGDKNVYFIDGSAFFNGQIVSDLTLDNTHPNDEGFRRMADYIGDIMAKVMNL